MPVLSFVLKIILFCFCFFLSIFRFFYLQGLVIVNRLSVLVSGEKCLWVEAGALGFHTHYLSLLLLLRAIMSLGGKGGGE